MGKELTHDEIVTGFKRLGELVMRDNWDISELNEIKELRKKLAPFYQHKPYCVSLISEADVIIKGFKL